MPRKRNPENAGLPARWRLTHGAYYYQVPPGTEAHWDGKKSFRLGKTLPESYRTWATRAEAQESITTIAALLDRYALEVIPTKAPKTQIGDRAHIPRLRAVFGEMHLLDIKPRHIYQYVDKRSKKTIDERGKNSGGPTVARQEIAVISHAFTKAVEWGLIDRHPFKSEVRMDQPPPHSRYVEDWEIIEALALPPQRKAGSVLMIQAYIRLKLLTGLRRADLLKLTMSDMHDDGIHVTPGKTEGSSGKRLVFAWNDERRAAVEMAKAARPCLSPFLFCNRLGECYWDEAAGLAPGWDSTWHRFMGRVMAETEVKARFTEHDLRAKVASDSESLERARALLGHTDSRITQRVYRRKPEVV